MKKKILPVILEVAGVAVVGTGIGLEMAKGGDVYLVVITFGSLLIAAGGLIFAKFMRKG